MQTPSSTNGRRVGHKLLMTPLNKKTNARQMQQNREGNRQPTVAFFLTAPTRQSNRITSGLITSQNDHSEHVCLSVGGVNQVGYERRVFFLGITPFCLAFFWMPAARAAYLAAAARFKSAR
jgi:hypothetical protein